MKNIEKSIYGVLKKAFSRGVLIESDNNNSLLSIKLKEEEIKKLEIAFTSDRYQDQSNILDQLNESFLLDSLENSITDKSYKKDKNDFFVIKMDKVVADIKETTIETLNKIATQNKRKVRP